MSGVERSRDWSSSVPRSSLSRPPPECHCSSPGTLHSSPSASQRRRRSTLLRSPGGSSPAGPGTRTRASQGCRDWTLSSSLSVSSSPRRRKRPSSWWSSCCFVPDCGRCSDWYRLTLVVSVGYIYNEMWRKTQTPTLLTRTVWYSLEQSEQALHCIFCVVFQEILYLFAKLLWHKKEVFLLTSSPVNSCPMFQWVSSNEFSLQSKKKPEISHHLPPRYVTFHSSHVSLHTDLIRCTILRSKEKEEELFYNQILVLMVDLLICKEKVKYFNTSSFLKVRMSTTLPPSQVQLTRGQ